MTETRRYFFRVEYDGADYAGWQRQDNAQTIQETLERAFTTVTRRPCAVTGAGRTDAGVHARRQGAHLDIDTPIDAPRIHRAVNAVLPPDIAIFDLGPVDREFHARYSAMERTYRYTFASDKHPLLRNRAWTVWYTVDWDRVEHNVSLLLGTHDFSSFCAADTTVENMICTIRCARIEHRSDLRTLTISADRFLYKMVRTIAGTLVEIGRGRLQTTISDIIALKDRRRAGPSAPPWALVLEDVQYPAHASSRRLHTEPLSRGHMP